MKRLKLTSDYVPKGDQPKAINQIVNNFNNGAKYQVLLGVTGSGKTFTMANVIEKLNLPTLIISHNKTLAAQLYGEMKGLFKENAVEYFVSYYDYYQPEAYVPENDIYIEKDASINEEIDKLRLKATASLLSRNDVIIVASVSCIYGLGAPEDYVEFLLTLKEGEKITREEIMEKLINMHYTRNDFALERGNFRVKGDTIDISLAYDDIIYRIEFFDDYIDKISEINKITGNKIKNEHTIAIYPAKHFITNEDKINEAIEGIKSELRERLNELYAANKLVEAQRLESRVNMDIEMLKEIGYCSGIENYSRHLSKRPKGSRPYCLLDFFPKEFLLIIDESHVTIPQIRGMYEGDKARKNTLVEYGFRLPSALDNRPLRFEEFESMIDKVLFVSATPSEYELNLTGGEIVEQIIRPTGLLDPIVEIKPADGQIDDLINEIKKEVENKGRVLVTTLTKKMSEDIADYLNDLDIKVTYLHSEIDTLERTKLLRELRLGKFDVLVGINLLREGLDLPEVSLVAILDADKEGFLRSEKSLIQIAGRAARHINGRVILYADKMTKSIENFVNETKRRREIQMEYNIKNNIIPKSIIKNTEEILLQTKVADSKKKLNDDEKNNIQELIKEDIEFENKEKIIIELKEKMKKAAENLDFEEAAKIRDLIKKIDGER